MIEAPTLKFLKGLSQNNNREWFGIHKKDYEASRENVLEFTSKIIADLAAFDDTIPTDLNPKDCVMRIYRDIRFSNDKTPFKTNFGIAISANGKNFKGPGYYIHIQPSKSFIAGGAWYPETDELKAIRQEIDYNGSELRSILNEDGFKKVFEDLDREGALKTTPKGYPADHEDINYLKLKSFTATSQIADTVLTGPGAVKKIVDNLEKIYPLTIFLRNAIS
ncbi:MAG: DUF2461 domain-containing protein [Sphingobacteriaceae bacterium]|nr:DUF2461 domain-containing protein [Sphingobacteriaceae bacterium]